jgi:NAD(P)-dependent dehydrogenase (short-subunit alcohol dehydrogenase family)
MNVVIADVDSDALSVAEAEIRANGAPVASKRTDVRSGEDVEALARFAADTFGRVNVLCNNAGSVSEAASGSRRCRTGSGC